MGETEIAVDSQFIKLYKNVLPPDLCSSIINTYEKLWKEQEEQIKKMSLCYSEDGKKLCTACDCQRLDIMQHHEFKELFNQVISRFQFLISQYKKDVIVHDCQWPERYRYEMNGKKVYAKEIYKNPDKYFTDDIMEKLNNIAVEEYSYGAN